MEGFDHVGVRGTRAVLRIPVIDVKISHGHQPSGVWHYAQPCQHRVYPAAPTVGIKYNSGPLWKDGYTWQNVYWGTYYGKASSSLWIRRLESATAHLESDRSYSAGLAQYNVGVGNFASSVVINQDPASQISNDQIKKVLMEWISAGTVSDLNTRGAYNIFLPPQTSVSLSSDLSCQTFCDFHDTIDGTNGPFYTVEPFPCSSGCNQCTKDPFDTLTQGLSEEMVELKTDMDPGTGWVIGNEEICDYCVPPDQLLLGDNKEISQYETGDMVLGSTGLQEIERRYERVYTGDLVEIRAEGMLPFRTTPNHPILISHETHHEVRNLAKKRYLDYRGHWRNRYHSVPEYGPIVWKTAGDLREKHSFSEGDCLVIPRIKGTLEVASIPLSPYTTRPKYFETKRLPLSFPLNLETAWLLGVYVAEGSTNNVHSVQFSLAEKEFELQNRIIKIISSLGYSAWKTKMPNEKCVRVFFNSRPMLRLLKDICGNGASQKRIPDIILYSKDTRVLHAFLEGYVAGDGYKSLDGYMILVTVSRLLIQQLQLAYARLGWFLKISKTRKGKLERVQGRDVNCHDQYTGRFHLKPKRLDYTRIHGNFFYVPIRTIGRIPYKGKVYNIGTRDHTYLVANAIVHNCDANFVCNKIATGEYVNSWFDKNKNACWKGI